MKERVKKLASSVSARSQQLFEDVVQTGIRAQWSNCANNRNFGDQLTPYLIRKITGQTAIYARVTTFRRNYLVTGSIVQRANSKSVIWGAGIQGDPAELALRGHPEVLATRGPLTDEFLVASGVQVPGTHGDPGVLLPLIFKPNASVCYRVGLVPHISEYTKMQSLMADKLLDQQNILIDLTGGVENTASLMNQCEMILSSSLHGVIVGLAYGIPTAWVEFRETARSGPIEKKGTLKYDDFFLSLGYSKLQYCTVRAQSALKNPESMRNGCLAIDVSRLQRNLVESIPFDQPMAVSF